MTYNTPELHLVGAAQNLVLDGSPKLGGKDSLAIEPRICDLNSEDPPADDYDPLPSW